MKKILFIIALTLVVVLAACGKDIEKDTKQASTSTSVTTKTEEKVDLIDASGEKLVFDKTPESFAALSSGDLDILLSLDANVTGRPSTKGEVTEAVKEIPEVGNPHQPNFEQLAAIHPDVLVAGLSFQRQAANLEKQGTKVVYAETNSIEDIQKNITMFGGILNNKTKADELNKKITDQIEAAKDKKGDAVKTLLVYGAPGTFLVALPNSLSGDILAKAGGENIAADFEKSEEYPSYANLSIERIVERNPEVVMLITHGDPSGVKAAFEKEMEQSAAWKNLDAVKKGNVVVLRSDLFGANPGTKVTDALEVMQQSLAAVK